MKLKNKRRWIIFAEIIFWLILFSILILAIISTILNFTTNQHQQLTKIMNTIALFLAILQSPLTLLKARSTLIHFVSKWNQKNELIKKQKEKEMLFRKRKEKQVQKAIKKQLINKRVNKKSEAILITKDLLEKRLIVLDEATIYQIFSMLKNDKVDESLNVVYQKTGKRIKREVLVEIKNKIKDL